MSKATGRKGRQRGDGKPAAGKASPSDAPAPDAAKTRAPDGLEGDQRNPLAPPINIEANS